MIVTTKKLLSLVLLSVFIVSGCAPASPPLDQLSVYTGSCHIIGKNVYFSYNGDSYVAKNQLAGYTAQSKINPYEIQVIEEQNGSFIIPNK